MNSKIFVHVIFSFPFHSACTQFERAHHEFLAIRSQEKERCHVRAQDAEIAPVGKYLHVARQTNDSKVSLGNSYLLYKLWQPVQYCIECSTISRLEVLYQQNLHT